LNPGSKGLRRFFEKILERFYEGPRAPERYAEEARIFAMMNVDAGPFDWEDYAIALASKAYEEGYVRGLERAERDLEGREMAEEEAQRERERHEWKPSDDPQLRVLLEGGGDPRDPLFGVPLEQRAEYFDALGLEAGTHTVLIPDEE
jgi:hypothetical protein